jgi:hypothetical protein
LSCPDICIISVPSTLFSLNLIKIYEIYSIKRPNNYSNADDPFYLAPITIPLEDSKTNIWFLRQKVGERKLSSLMKKMKESGINKRLTNNSARECLLQKLREKTDFSPVLVIGCLSFIADIFAPWEAVFKVTSPHLK